MDQNACPTFEEDYYLHPNYTTFAVFLCPKFGRMRVQPGGLALDLSRTIPRDHDQTQVEPSPDLSSVVVSVETWSDSCWTQLDPDRTLIRLGVPHRWVLVQPNRTTVRPWTSIGSHLHPGPGSVAQKRITHQMAWEFQTLLTSVISLSWRRVATQVVAMETCIVLRCFCKRRRPHQLRTQPAPLDRACFRIFP